MVAVPCRGLRITTIVTGSLSGSRSLSSGLMITLLPASTVATSSAATGGRLGGGRLVGGAGPLDADVREAVGSGEGEGDGESVGVGEAEGGSVGVGEVVGGTATGGRGTTAYTVACATLPSASATSNVKLSVP